MRAQVDSSSESMCGRRPRCESLLRQYWQVLALSTVTTTGTCTCNGHGVRSVHGHSTQES